MFINFPTILGSVVDTKVLATLGTVLGLILADFVFGVLVSLRNSDFSLSKLPQFVKTSLIPYIGGLLALALFSNANAELSALFFTIAATITVKFLADITAKDTQLFNGIQSQIQSPINVGSPSIIIDGCNMLISLFIELYLPMSNAFRQMINYQLV